MVHRPSGFSLNAGVSGKYTYYKQGEQDYKRFHPQPRLLAQYRFKNNMSLRCRFNMKVTSPSLSDLNDVEQEMDQWQIKRGNLFLLNSKRYSQSVMYSYNHKYFDVELIGAGYNADKWNVSAGLFLPFSSDYSQATRNLSKAAASYSNVYSRDFQTLVYVAASINLDFGKRKNTQRQRVNNQDAGSRVLQSGKISM